MDVVFNHGSKSRNKISDPKYRETNIREKQREFPERSDDSYVCSRPREPVQVGTSQRTLEKSASRK